MNEFQKNMMLYGSPFKVMQPTQVVEKVVIGKEQGMEEKKTNIPKTETKSKFDFGHGPETVDDVLERHKKEREKMDRVDKVLTGIALAAGVVEVFLIGKLIGQRQGYSQGLEVGRLLGEHGVYSSIADILKKAGGAA